MKLRKLEMNEHSQTRKLWEKVFAEDSKVFLDYYYFIKVKDNQIYVIEEEGDIRSMLQLNPYMLRVEEKQFLCNYIVAVATEDIYRKRGYMGQLLRTSLMDMYTRKEPFTFLMPAAEAIYTPYDFRFAYKQNQSESMGGEGMPEAELMDAGMQDAAEMADLFQSHFAEAYQVYAVRDVKYYQTMLFEQQSVNGGIKLLKKDGAIVGMFAYAFEADTVTIREPLYLEDYEQDFHKAVAILRKGRPAPVKVLAGRASADSVGVPLIMVRIVHLETLLSSMKVKEGEALDCSFAVLDSILTKNSRVFRIQKLSDSSIQVKETEDSEGVLTIAALASLLFGFKKVDELREEDDVIITERLAGELEKIQPLSRIFLNEMV